MPEANAKGAQPAPPRLMIGGPGPPRSPMGATERAEDAQVTVLRLWSYLSRRKAPLIMVAIMVVISTVLQMIAPYLMGKAIDDYIIPGDLPGLARICAVMLAIYIVISLLTWLVLYVMAGVAQHTVRALRTDLFSTWRRFR